MPRGCPAAAGRPGAVPASGGIVDLPAVFIALAVTGMLLVGTRESATVNFVLVCVKLVALAGFVALTLPHFDAGQLPAVRAVRLRGA